MSEQRKPKSFMEELDEWTHANVVMPLYEADRYEPDKLAGGNVSEFQTAVEAVKRAIREKVLESYKNGIKAGSRPLPTGARKETSRAQAQAR